MELTSKEGNEIVWNDHPDWTQVDGTEIMEDGGRWSNCYNAVFFHKPSSTYYSLSWQQGATENQEEEPFEYNTPEPIEVVQKEVTEMKWVPING